MEKYSIMTANELADILGLKLENIVLYWPDKILQLKNILIHALDTFNGNKTVVRYWLSTSIAELNDQTPLQIMASTYDFSLIDNVLGRLDYGLPA
ncbi:antitoxin Xre/MbcA/ParS toxin-binding domain-containing protein [Dyadobacter subterraneus]|uniref:DUF2384 domain-containing protein n=1 Tax=Dyadobacter subterraneus TaxID=2773304 RepID=A0ABR9WM69_9BACT|nr:MbcA/ParS/Xre antitoxin family protein [Dyadobacter subterraneus]MBE9465976.1 DUF2384 domain-containing protein [Dyadobacter subterraneus]